MPRPASLVELFGPDPPDDWETVADFERFYIARLKDALRAGGLRAKASSLEPALPAVTNMLGQTGWETQFPSKDWQKTNKNSLNRACRKSLLNFPRAALVILAAEATLSPLGIDVYDYVKVIPATSYISGLTFEVYADLLKRLQGENGNPIRYLKRNLAQVNDNVFVDMVRGKTVTSKLAEDMLGIILKANPSFGGVVSDDFDARSRAIKRLREADSLALGKKKARYAKKISASSEEVFWG